MVSNFNAAWFTGKLEEQQLSKRQLAKLMGLDPAAVSLMLRGLRKMSANEAGEIASLLGVTVEEVLRHAGAHLSEHSGNSVPIIGWIDAQNEIRFDRPAGPGTAEAPANATQDTVALRVQATGAMFDGWLLYYRPIEGISLEALGRLCVVKVAPNGPDYVMPVSRGYEAGKYNLGGWNTGLIANVSLISAAPITWMKQ